jgi:formate hydrogenlyase subunit 3/multisubunit Na+/H+ antiporter MnhD subunit
VVTELLGPLLWIVIAAPALAAVLTRLLPIRGHRWFALAGIAVSLLGVVILATVPTPQQPPTWPTSADAGEGWLAWDRNDPLPAVLACAVALVAVLQAGGTARRDASAVAASLAGALLVVVAFAHELRIVGLVASSAAMALLLGSRGGRVVRPGFLVLHALAVGLMAVGASGLVHTRSPLPEPLGHLLLAVGVMLRVGVPPVHGAAVGVFASAPLAARLVVGVLVPLTSLLVLSEFRFSPGRDGTLVAALLGLPLVVYGSLAALGAASVHRMASGSLIATLGSALIVLAAAGEVAGLAIVSAATGPAAIAVLAAILQRRAGSDAFASLGGLSRSMPKLMSLAIASALVAASAPPSSGFAALAVVSGKLMFGAGWVAVILAGAWVVQVAAAVRLVRRVFFGGPITGAAAAATVDADGRELLALGVLVGFAVLAGVLPFAA